MYKIVRYINDEATTFFEFTTKERAEKALKELMRTAKDNEYYILIKTER